MVGHDDERARARLLGIEEDVIRGGRIERVGSNRDERALWRACDIASAVEGAFHERIDPSVLDGATEEEWIQRLRGSFVFPSFDALEAEHDVRDLLSYWILDREKRIGTVQLESSTYRGPWLYLQSLYVRPEHRGRGVAGALLADLARAACAHGLVGLRLATSWTWQKSLRFYLARGFWVRMWKHDIQLVFEPGLPVQRVTIGDAHATFDVVVGDTTRRLLAASREGEHLKFEEAEPCDDVELWSYAVGTFAMHLALAGWPLVRSEAEWARRYESSDAGKPEGLAYKIGVFEEVAKNKGWVVETSRIPGLERWQAWARGEEHGRNKQRLRDLETVLVERGFSLDKARTELLRHLDPNFAVDDLLRRAVTVPSFEAFWAHAEKHLERWRRS